MIERDGWDSEDGLLIHLESEASVDMQGYAFTLEDEVVFGGSSVEAAMDYVDRRFASDGHSLNWTSD